MEERDIEAFASVHSADRMRRIDGRRALAHLLAIFGGAHLFYYVAFGVRFDANTLTRFSQYIENDCLRERFWESLLYLHSQPPAFNAFLGVVLNAFPTQYAAVFHGLYLVLGFLLLWVVHRLMRELGAGDRIALAACALFAFSPSFLLYEHWLFYSLPEALLLASLCLAWFRALESRRSGTFAWFFALLLFLCALRSLFHLAYFLLSVVVLCLACRAQWKSVVRCAAVPFLLLFSLYLKNWVLFGEFNTSSWLGMNLARVTVVHVPLAERERLVAEGTLSPVSLVSPFSTLDKYPPAFRELPAVADVPTLTRATKLSGDPNYNHAAYVRISRAYLADDLWVLRNRPGAFLEAQRIAWWLYFQPSSEYALLEQRRIKPMIRLYDRLFHLQIPGVKVAEMPLHLTLLLGLPLLVAYGLWRALRRSSMTAPVRGLLLFLCANILFVALVGNLLELGENNRFRFVTDPLSLVLLALAFHHLAQRFRRNGVSLGTG